MSKILFLFFLNMIKIHLHQKAIVFNDENKFLVLKSTYKGFKRDLPGGGLEFPELHLDALRREIKEETGLAIENITLLDIQTAYNEEEDAYVIFVGYQCLALPGDIQVSDEHAEFAWVTKDQFLQMDATLYLKDFIKEAI